MEETQVPSLCWEDPLEEGMATHSSVLAWRIPWTEEPGWAKVHGVAKGRTGLQQLSAHASQHVELCLMFRGNLDGRGSGGERICAYMWLDPLTVLLKLTTPLLF